MEILHICAMGVFVMIFGVESIVILVIPVQQTTLFVDSEALF
jgi:hypothetical protein